MARNQATAVRGARRIGPPGEVRARAALPRIDYSDAFAVDGGGRDSRGAEEWIRAVFEAAPPPVRAFLRYGWAILGARLGPSRSPEHVLGWRVGASEREYVRLEVDWTIGLHANLVLHSGSRVVLATFVELDSAASRVVWRLLVSVHHATLRYLLTRAAGARPLTIRFQRRVLNPVARSLAPHLPGSAVVETTGRRSGLPRRTPVGGRRDGSTFWLVSEFGRQSHYVRNIGADPRVRVLVDGRWHTGTAVVLDDDDPHARLRSLPLLNSAAVRLVGTHLLTVRIDLDPSP